MPVLAKRKGWNGLKQLWKQWDWVTGSTIIQRKRQRVAIARALINDPAIIMADEPTGNLDTKSSYEIMDIFKKMNDNGKTVVMVTHEPDIAEQTKRILTMRDGKLVSDEWRADHV